MILIYYDHGILRLLQANQLVGEIGYLRQISWLVKEVQIYLVTCAVTAMGISHDPTTWLGVNTIPYYSIRPVPTNPKRSTWNWPAPDDIRNSMDPAISGMSCNEQNFRINHKSEKEPLAKIRIQSFRNVILVTSLRMMFSNFGGLGFWNPLAVSGKSRFHNCVSVNPRSSYQSSLKFRYVFVGPRVLY